MKKGIFITMEGPEGAGKTTILEMLYEHYIEKGIKIVKTREPGGIRISEKIREIILNPDHTEMDGRTEALLYAAARRQHLVEKVIPALEEGAVVLSDRFIDSSLAYQGYARGIGIEEIWKINEFAIGEVMPDLTLYFDLDPEAGLARINKSNNREINRLDLEQLDFHQRVQEGYYTVIDKFPERLHKIEASQGVEDVFEQSLRAIDAILNR